MPLIHTCYRITDIDRSIAFYNALGFQEVGRIPIKDEAVNVFMNQLTYNFGVDSYELGTAYGHIAITTPDLDATLASLAEQGIEPEKPPYTVREGGSRLCFVRDRARASTICNSDTLNHYASASSARPTSGRAISQARR